MLDGDTSRRDNPGGGVAGRESSIGSLWGADHRLMRFAGMVDVGQECWSLLAALAAATRGR